MKEFFIKKMAPLLLCGFFLLTLTGCDQENMILTNVDETDANQIIVLLESKGITTTKTPVKTSGAGASQSTATMWDIMVSSSRSTEALAILNRIGLPRKPGISILDLFPQQGMMKTEKEEQIRYNEGLNEQLANTLRKIDGILDVEVQISFPQEDTFNPDAQKEYPRASVFIKHDGILDDPNNLLPQKIRRYISGSILDLRYEDVTVVADKARFTDISVNALEPKTEASPWGTQDYVKIWSVIVEVSSAPRFRTILLLFSLSVLLLIAALVWMAWKFQKGLKQVKNYGEFFRPKPFDITFGNVEEEQEKEEP